MVTYNYESRPFEIEDASGISVFYRDAAGDIFHTYSCFARGGEKVLAAYMLLDLTPLGRNEPGPHGGLTDWVRHHDRYGDGAVVEPTGRYRPAETANSCCGADEVPGAPGEMRTS